MNPERVRLLNSAHAGQGPVLYWMGRDQRVQHNWALLFAADIAKKKGVPLYVLFCIVPDYSVASATQYQFMISGLKEVAHSLRNKGIPFILKYGDAIAEVYRTIKEIEVSTLIMDFDPLRPRTLWKDSLLKKINIPLYEVDAHNIVTCWKASPKAEFGAYTLRPKIQQLLPAFMEPLPELPVFSGISIPDTDWSSIPSQLFSTAISQQQDLPKAGEIAAVSALNDFIENRLPDYQEHRNDPCIEGQSGLSAYLHYGQLSAQYLAQCIQKTDVNPDSKSVFLEELIIRRELSDNFCYYNSNYDNINGLPTWARKSLETHRKDERSFVYTLAEWESCKTHDELWNAAQYQLLQTGKMHGYMRMYWAKKILEWSKSPEHAIKYAIYLNDHYSLDGRDPNGYAGILWSIGGLHDRAWGERAVFGKIRYMNAEGCKRKFDVKKYIARWKK